MDYSFRLLFENRSISILSYNPETVLSEKNEENIWRHMSKWDATMRYSVN
jgi:hypothetical protein